MLPTVASLVELESYSDARGFPKTIRAAQSITYDKNDGEIGRTVVYPRIK